MKKILLLPTIRMELAKKCIEAWQTTALKKEDIEFRIIIPENCSINLPADIKATVVVENREEYAPGQGITCPLYQLTKDLVCDSDRDIIIAMGDDFFPCQSWDVFLEEQFKGFSGLFVSFDGIQLTSPMATIPILDYALLKILNKAIYHTAYFHMYSDNELYVNCKQLNMVKDIRPIDKNVYFKHCHYTVSGRVRPKDKIDNVLDILRSYDGTTYEKRMRMSLQDRLKVVNNNIEKNNIIKRIKR